jgi:hypothetical protein
MPRIRGRGGDKARGIGTKRRGEGLFNKRGIDGVTNIKERCLDTDCKIGLIDGT